MKRSALAISLLMGCVLSLNKIPSDTYLRTVNETMFGEPINGVSQYFGSSSKMNKMVSNFDLQFGYKEMVVGNKNEMGWGILCGDGKENMVTTCEYDKVNEGREGIGLKRLVFRNWQSG